MLLNQTKIPYSNICMKTTIFNMIGGGFQHAHSSCGWEHPKNIKWNKTDHSGPISVHIDGEVFSVPVNRSKLNIAWFCESPYFTRSYTKQLDTPEIKSRILSDFKFIFSNDKELIQRHTEIIYLLPHAYTWVKNKNIFPKNKLWSIIASSKKDAPGHRFRHVIVESYQGHVEVFGSGYKKIENKNEGLNDFMYSFAIENIKAEGYWTEKVVDCFATGTIPIYWGAESLSDFFIEEGIVRLVDDFDLSIFDEDFYKSKKEAICENFNRAINLPLPEDYILLNYL
jgi:hypothetical protein